MTSPTEDHSRRVGAVIVAAGRSSRMGRSRQDLRPAARRSPDCPRRRGVRSPSRHQRYRAGPGQRIGATGTRTGDHEGMEQSQGRSVPAETAARTPFTTVLRALGPCDLVMVHDGAPPLRRPSHPGPGHPGRCATWRCGCGSSRQGHHQASLILAGHRGNAGTLRALAGPDPPGLPIPAAPGCPSPMRRRFHR